VRPVVGMGTPGVVSPSTNTRSMRICRLILIYIHLYSVCSALPPCYAMPCHVCHAMPPCHAIPSPSLLFITSLIKHPSHQAHHGIIKKTFLPETPKHCPLQDIFTCPRPSIMPSSHTNSSNAVMPSPAYPLVMHPNSRICTHVYAAAKTPPPPHRMRPKMKKTPGNAMLTFRECATVVPCTRIPPSGRRHLISPPSSLPPENMIWRTVH
jgi:hypothetical protein